MIRPKVVVICSLIALPLLGGVAGAQADLDCDDFVSEEQATAFMQSNDPADTNDLDEDGDGVACESKLPSNRELARTTTPVSRTSGDAALPETGSNVRSIATLAAAAMQAGLIMILLAQKLELRPARLVEVYWERR